MIAKGGGVMKTFKQFYHEGTKSQMIDYVKDIAFAIRKGGFENIEKYADKFEKDVQAKSLDPEKELNKIPKINKSQVANLLNMSFTEKPNTQDAMKRYKVGKAGFTDKVPI